MSVETPHYRCTACGNLTRFDVVTTSTVKTFHHFTVGGVVDVEETDVLSHAVDSVTCRWCGHGRAIEVISATEHAESDEAPVERAE